MTTEPHPPVKLGCLFKDVLKVSVFSDQDSADQASLSAGRQPLAHFHEHVGTSMWGASNRILIARLCFGTISGLVSTTASSWCHFVPSLSLLTPAKNTLIGAAPVAWGA